MNVRFQYEADIHQRLLSSESGHSARYIDLVLLCQQRSINYRSNESFLSDQKPIADRRILAILTH